LAVRARGRSRRARSRALLAALSAPRYCLKKEAEPPNLVTGFSIMSVITLQIAVVLPLTLILLIATLVLVSLVMRE